MCLSVCVCELPVFVGYSSLSSTRMLMVNIPDHCHQIPSCRHARVLRHMTCITDFPTATSGTGYLGSPLTPTPCLKICAISASSCTFSCEAWAVAASSDIGIVVTPHRICGFGRVGLELKGYRLCRLQAIFNMPRPPQSTLVIKHFVGYSFHEDTGDINMLIQHSPETRSHTPKSESNLFWVIPASCSKYASAAGISSPGLQKTWPAPALTECFPR